MRFRVPYRYASVHVDIPYSSPENAPLFAHYLEEKVDRGICPNIPLVPDRDHVYAPLSHDVTCVVDSHGDCGEER